MRALLIANSGDNDGGVVGERFRELGYVFEHWVREEAATWPDLPNDVRLVLSLGSDWSVYWSDIAGQVRAEADLLRSAHGRSTPIFGICFGGQILAHALGGRVERAERPEIGWFSVDFNPELTKFRQNVWFQWHYDRFLAPADARQLATGDLGDQAFLLGNSLGLQFHPEVTPEIVARWANGAGADELLRVGLDPHGVVAESSAHAHMSRTAGCELVDWFVDCVRISPQSRGG